MLTITFGYNDEYIPRKNTPINGAVVIYDVNAEEPTFSAIDDLIEQMADAYGAPPYREHCNATTLTDTPSMSPNNIDFLLQIVSASNPIAFEKARQTAIETELCCLTLLLSDKELSDDDRDDFPAPYLWTPYDDFQDVLRDWVEVVHLPSYHIGLDFGDISLLLNKETKGRLYRITPGELFNRHSAFLKDIQQASSTLVVFPAREMAVPFKLLEGTIAPFEKAMHPEDVALWAFRHCVDSKDIHIYCFKKKER